MKNGTGSQKEKDMDPEVVVRQWRTTVLNVFFAVVAVISLPAVGTIIATALSNPEIWLFAIAFSVVELLLIALAVLRGLPVTLRVLGLCLVGYSAAILNLINSGLNGAGPIYLLVIPILVLILMGKRAGLLATIFSALLATGGALLLTLGILVPDLTVRNPSAGLASTIMFLTVVMTILILFYGLQERLIKDERRAQAELRRTQGLLEEHNATLEQKIQERTGELQASNLSLEQRNSELAIINKIQQALASKLDFQSIIDLFGDEIMRIFPPEKGSAQDYSVLISLYDAETGMISFPYLINGEGTRFAQPAMALGPGLTSTVIRSGRPLLLNSQEEQIAHGLVDYVDERLQAKSQSWLGVPIRSGDRVTGVFSVEDPRPNLFGEPDARLLSTLAASLGVALENTRLFAEIQEQKKFSETLIHTSPVAIVILDRDNQVASWNPAAEKLFGYSERETLGCSIIDLVTDEETRDESLAIARRMARGEAVYAITRRRTREGRDVDVELFAVPVFLEEKRVGTFAIYHDITELKRAQAATQESERRLADIINFLPDATLVVDGAGKVIAWNRAIEEMTGIVAAEMLGKGDQEYALTFYGERRPILIDLVLSPQEAFEQEQYAQIRRTGETLTGETYTPALQSGPRYLFAMATPLHDVHGNIVGAIETIRDITERKQAEEALQKAKAEAEQANQRMEQELALAGTIQAGFMASELPRIAGWQRAASLIPARQTSGDFYDIYPLGDGRYAILVADVVDKGVGAALCMAFCWALVHSYARQHPDRPDFVMQKVNQRLFSDTHSGQFVTLFYGVLDAQENVLHYCNAGHNPPYLFSTGAASVQSLGLTGLPLGILPEMAWQSRRARFQSGDLLVLYTDGVTETENAGQDFYGSERLIDVVRGNLGKSAQEIQETVIRGLCEFAGRLAVCDDITLMVLACERTAA